MRPGGGTWENALGQEEREDWTEDPMDGAEGQAWLKPDELGGRVRRISPEADDYGKTPNDVQQLRGADQLIACSDGQRGPDEHGSMLWLLGRPDAGGRVGKTLTTNESVKG